MMTNTATTTTRRRARRRSSLAQQPLLSCSLSAFWLLSMLLLLPFVAGRPTAPAQATTTTTNTYHHHHLRQQQAAIERQQTVDEDDVDVPLILFSFDEAAIDTRTQPQHKDETSTKYQQHQQQRELFGRRRATSWYSKWKTRVSQLVSSVVQGGNQVCHVEQRNDNDKLLLEVKTMSNMSKLTRFLHLALHPDDTDGTCGNLDCTVICDDHNNMQVDESVTILNGIVCTCGPMETLEIAETCDEGYEWVDTTQECQDINECALDNDLCLNHETLGEYVQCINIPGSYECTCMDGMFPSSETGACVIACANPGGNPCGPGGICQDDENLGHTCTYQYENVCFGGCDTTTSTCIDGICQCIDGHVRPEPLLPCRPV